ncbi:MAG: S9 family peptidase [Rubrivivax sp.]|nr:S9 family peptidase [Rubrivivax sp.]
MWTRRRALGSACAGVSLSALAGSAWGQTPAPAPATATAGPVPLEHFFQRALMRGAKLSPDGTKVAMTISAQEDGRARLAVVDLTTMKSQAIAAISQSDIDRFAWVNDEDLVFDTELELVDYWRVDYGPGLYAVDVQGRALRQLVDTGWQPQDGVERKLLHWRYQLMDLPAWPEGRSVLVIKPDEVSSERVGHYDLRWLDVRHRLNRAVDVPQNSEAWAFDAQGELRAAVVREGEQRELFWREPEGSWKTLQRSRLNDDQGWWPLWVDNTGQLYVTASHQGREALFKVDPATGRLPDKPLAWHPKFDVHPRLLLREGQLVGLRYTIDAEVTQWLDPKLQALQERVDKALPGAVNRLSLAQHGASPWVLVQNFSDQQPLRALAFNTESQRFVRLGESRPRIEARRMGTLELHWIPARDGRSLPVWLTLPAGAAKQNLPMVVWVHGGPWARGAAWQWQDEVQFLASRGYAVLQPEFRGSLGYGHDHFRAGWKQWGQAMQTDLADAARWAIAQKVADPRRIGILGASYGGYASLMGLASEPDLFRAGVAWVAVSDLELMYSLRWSDLTRETKTLGLPRLMGDPKADAEMLRAHSPLRLADRIRNPLLLAHGAWDARVPLDHAEALLKSLRPHHQNLEWVLYKNEGHGWRRPENLIDFWQRVERFLARHLAA